jgi:hypothetical protein
MADGSNGAERHQRFERMLLRCIPATRKDRYAGICGFAARTVTWSALLQILIFQYKSNGDDSLQWMAARGFSIRLHLPPSI